MDESYKALFKEYVVSVWGEDVYNRVEDTDTETFAVQFGEYVANKLSMDSERKVQKFEAK